MDNFFMMLWLIPSLGGISILFLLVQSIIAGVIVSRTDESSTKKLALVSCIVFVAQQILTFTVFHADMVGYMWQFAMSMWSVFAFYAMSFAFVALLHKIFRRFVITLVCVLMLSFLPSAMLFFFLIMWIL